MDIREMMAQEIAEQIGAEVLEETCQAVINDEGHLCRWPLMMKADQGLAFCWGCATDRRWASNGRTALTKAKLASRGIMIGDSLREQYRNWASE